MFKKLGEVYERSLHLSPEADTEYFDIVGDLLAREEVSGLAKYVQHDTINRLQHITSVSYMSYRWCKQKNYNYKTAARAGILHDLFYYDWHDKSWSHRPHGYRHPGFAAENAKKLLGSTDKLTDNIIRRHMWPLTVIPPRYKEGFVVSLSDKYCAARELIYCQKQKRG